MRGFFTLFSLVALASTSVFAGPVLECMDELCGGKGFSNSSPGLTDSAASIAKLETPTRSISERGIEQWTNAERFIRGLPPKKPKLVKGSPLRRSQSSPAPLTTYRGIIKIDRADNGANLGYLSKNPFNGAQSRYESIENALIVSFKSESDQISGAVSDFTFEDSTFVGNYQRLGLVQGRDDTSSDIASGSYHYLYIAATTPTAPNATPQTVPNSYSDATTLARTAESEVWLFDSVTKELTVQWVNTDGSKPKTLLWTQSTALYAGGDPAAFNARYPSPVIPVKYTFVPV